MDAGHAPPYGLTLAEFSELEAHRHVPQIRAVAEHMHVANNAENRSSGTANLAVGPELRQP